jgi:hypothetical protein
MKYFRGPLRFLQQHKRNPDISVMGSTRKRREKRRTIMRDSYCLYAIEESTKENPTPTKDRITTIFEHETSTPRLRAWRAKHGYD